MNKIVLFGDLSDGHVGRHFQSAAPAAAVDAVCVDSKAMYGSGILQRLSWHCLGRRPLHLRHAIDQLSLAFADGSRRYLLTTGLCPLPAKFISALRVTGVKCGIFLTDDPFNARHHAALILATIPAYNVVFTPRQANMADLYSVGAARVELLPFAYDPETHMERADDIGLGPLADVMFVGGADADRIPFANSLVEAGFSVALYGGYWDREKRLRAYAKGVRPVHEIRRAAKSAKVQVILVRRANRDGHVMRTYEAAATRSCLIVEDSEDHRALFGEEGDAVSYFRSPRDLVSGVRVLVEDGVKRARLADRAYAKVVEQTASTYADRLRTVLESLDAN